MEFPRRRLGKRRRLEGPSESVQGRVARKRVVRGPGARRRGVTSLDYVLTLGITIPMVGFVLWAAPMLMNHIYQVFWVYVGWPFP